MRIFFFVLLPYKCRKVTDVSKRRTILRKTGRCFRCLEKSHMSKDCPSNYICRIRNGKHNITLCENTMSEKKTDPTLTATAATENKSNIMLMTARCKISDVNSKNISLRRTIFDSGSMRSYCTEEVRRKLSLPTLRKEKIILNTFGNKTSETKKVDIVQ